MTFSTIALQGNRTVVRGTDKFGTDGTTVLDTTQWADIVALDTHKVAEAGFDDAVLSFFKPITDAADAFEEATASTQVDDPISYLVMAEGTEGVRPVAEKRITLNHASQVLRLIELNHTDRLVWVGERLEILAPDNTVQPALVADPLAQAVAVVEAELGGVEV